MLSIDFRMTSTTLLSDVRAAGGHLVREVRPVRRPTCTRSCTRSARRSTHRGRPASDFDAFHTIARVFSRLAEKHLGVRRDVVMTPLQHDTPGETAYPGGVERDWRRTGEVPVPGKTMGNIAVVTRDYPALAEQWETLGPLVDKLGLTTKGVTVHPDVEVADLAARHGVMGARRRRRPAGDRHRDEDGRHHPGAVRHLERPARGRGLPGTGAAHRPAAGPPRRGQRGAPHHLRRLPRPGRCR